ncbi:MAG TPA: hemerythrin domain-containing protein [Mycobacteriales bacterium]|nr:hemerythrin domain-containing protein [Mycobacteriales bacterium]
MCDHCGCRQGSIKELMDQHEVISAIADDARRCIADGDEWGARARLDDLMDILRPHVEWEEAGLFARMAAQGDFADHIVALEAEHASLYAQVEAAATAPDWASAVLTMLTELDEHIYRENFGLFPGAISVLDAGDWDAIDAVRPAACACGGSCGKAMSR